MRIKSRPTVYLILLGVLVLAWGALAWMRTLNLAAIVDQKQVDVLYVSSDLEDWQPGGTGRHTWCVSRSEPEGCAVDEAGRTEITSALRMPGRARYLARLPVPVTDHRPYLVRVRFTDGQELVLASHESSPPGEFYGNLKAGGPWPGRLFYEVFRYENQQLQAVLDGFVRR